MSARIWLSASEKHGSQEDRLHEELGIGICSGDGNAHCVRPCVRPASGTGGSRPLRRWQGAAGAGRGGGRGPPPPPAGPMPKLPDGHPDMQGFWTPPAITDIEPAPARGGGARGAAEAQPAGAVPRRRLRAAPRLRPGLAGGGGIRIIDPPDGKIPYKPEARAKQQDILQNHMADEPELHCYQSGVPHSESNQFGVQIIQTPGYFVQLSEFMHTVRIIPTDNRPAYRPKVQAVPGRSGRPLGRRHAGGGYHQSGHQDLVRHFRQLQDRRSARDREVHSAGREHHRLRSHDHRSRLSTRNRGRRAGTSTATGRPRCPTATLTSRWNSAASKATRIWNTTPRTRAARLPRSVDSERLDFTCRPGELRLCCSPGK